MPQCKDCGDGFTDAGLIYHKCDERLANKLRPNAEVDRLERENAQLKAVIVEQNTVISMLQGLVTEQKETIEKLRLAYADSVIESGGKAELIEKLAQCINEAGELNKAAKLSPVLTKILREGCTRYREWKK